MDRAANNAGNTEIAPVTDIMPFNTVRRMVVKMWCAGAKLQGSTASLTSFF